VLRGVTVVNDIDNTSPSTTFRFLRESIVGRDVIKAPKDVMIGCECAKKHASLGCSYLNDCSCLQDSAEKNNKKAFPYTHSSRNRGCLRPVYLESRNHIYECNDNCDCNAGCKNRLVQHGRQVGLEIFKTQNRGWGESYSVADIRLIVI